MGAGARNGRDSDLTVGSPAWTDQPSARLVRLSQLRKLCECEQVAAVCYRWRNDCIEFLLVRTRGGERWTFPKGSAEPGLTHAQAAALEAFEEAGVHGRIEEASFATYVRRERRGGAKSHSRSGRTSLPSPRISAKCRGLVLQKKPDGVGLGFRLRKRGGVCRRGARATPGPNSPA